jgi:Zn-dependent protease
VGLTIDLKTEGLMDSKEIKTLMLWISVGLRVWNARLVLLLTLVMVFGLFCWAMWNANYFTIGCAALFAILVFLPIIKMDGKQAADRAVINPEGSQDG